MSEPNSDSRATGEQGAIAEPAGVSVAPEDSVEAVERCPECGEVFDENRMCSHWRAALDKALLVVEAPDSVEEIEAMLAAHEMADNPCAAALDQLWREIILARNPNYGDWEYPMQAYRHLKCEFDDVAKQRDQALLAAKKATERAESYNAGRAVYFNALQGVRRALSMRESNKVRVPDILLKCEELRRERDEAQAQRRELARALKPFADYAKCGGDDDDSVRIGHYFGGPTMGECRKARALLAAHPEWFK